MSLVELNETVAVKYSGKQGWDDVMFIAGHNRLTVASRNF